MSKKALELCAFIVNCLFKSYYVNKTCYLCNLCSIIFEFQSKAALLILVCINQQLNLAQALTRTKWIEICKLCKLWLYNYSCENNAGKPASLEGRTARFKRWQAIFISNLNRSHFNTKYTLHRLHPRAISLIL